MKTVCSISKCTILLSVLLSFLLFSCSKNSSPDAPPSPVDTLGSGWKKITVPDLSFNDIFFINNNIGFAVAATDIFKSSDGGNNWQKVYQTANGFVNIAMGNESNAAFFTFGNKIIFTKDGGTSFDSVTINGDAIDGFFVNATTVYSVGKSFWKSTNAGSTWTKLYDFPSTGYKSLHFLNDQNGWVAGTGGVYKTINGGVSWELKTPGPDFDFNIGYGSVFFPDANNGYISDGYHIGKTTNSGTSWSRLFTGGPNYQDLHFVSATTGYFTDTKYIYKTIDGGATWNKDVVLQDKTIVELHFTDATHGWACGTSGVILKYQN